MQHISESCSNCSTDVKSRKRDFSEQAWTVLLLWNEVQKAAVDQPICENCYNELREVLIDRVEEIETALKDTGAKRPSVPTTSQPARRAVRKAG